MSSTLNPTSVLVVRFAATGYIKWSDTSIERIIVPLDGSDLADKALGPARDLAQRTGAHVSLVTTGTAEGQETADHLDRAAAQLDGVATEIVLRAEHDPVEAIAALLADSEEMTWIVMSSHGRGRLIHAVLGSVAERIVAEVDVPVVIVGPSYDPQLHFADGPIAVAHDGVHSPDADVAKLLCDAAGARAVVLEVGSGATARAPSSAEAVPSPLVALWTERLRALGVEATIELRPALSMPRAVADEATEIGASAVLLTSRATTGVRRFLGGSHTAGTVRHSAVPVVVVRAETVADGLDGVD